MFLLSKHYYDEVSYVGVFNTAEKAKKYISKIRHENVSWSSPNLNGAMWADCGGGTYFINPVEVNPRQP